MEKKVSFLTYAEDAFLFFQTVREVERLRERVKFSSASRCTFLRVLATLITIDDPRDH